VEWITASGKVLGVGAGPVSIRTTRTETIYVIVGTPSHELVREPVQVNF